MSSKDSVTSSKISSFSASLFLIHQLKFLYLIVFKRFCCFFEFGPFMFFAMSDVSYLHRKFLSNIDRYKPNSKK